MQTPRDEGRYAGPPPKVTLDTLDERVSNIERLLVQMHGEMTPKWVRVGGWATIVGSVLGAALKVLVDS